MKNLIAYCGLDCENAHSARHSNCGDCSAMDGCQTIGMVLANNPEAAENLKNKEIGEQNDYQAL